MSTILKSRVSPISETERENIEETARKLWRNYHSTKEVCEDAEEKLLQTGETMKKRLFKKKASKHQITNENAKISFNILIDEKVDQDLSTDVSDKTDSNTFPLIREDFESSTTQPTDVGSDSKGEDEDKLFVDIKGINHKLLRKLIELFDCKYLPQSILFRDSEARKIKSFVRG